MKKKSQFVQGSTSFLCYEKLGEFCCSFQIVVCIGVGCILCYILGSLSFEDQIVISQRGVLKTFYPAFCFTVAEVDARTILYHFKRLIGLVPIGEGPGDVAQWRG